MADFLTPHLDGIAGRSDILPLAPGMEILKSTANGQLQLHLSETYTRRMRYVFGYIAEIKLTCGEGTSTPVQLQIVCQIPYWFGDSAAERPSFIAVRIQAFVSKALFSSAVTVLRVGMPVAGYIEPTNGPSKSAQLCSWHEAISDKNREFFFRPYAFSPFIIGELDVWKTISPLTLPLCWEFGLDPIYVIPQLHSQNFDYSRVPHLNAGCFSAPRMSAVLSLPQNMPPVLATQIAAQEEAHDRLVGRKAPLVKAPPSMPPPAADSVPTPAALIRTASVPAVSTPAPPLRGRSPVRLPSPQRTPGGASSAVRTIPNMREKGIYIFHFESNTT